MKKQLDTELEHLTNSFQSLRSAQSKFRECVNSLKAGLSSTSSTSPKPILVPLTSSLYVPGTLADTDKVIVDVGTGFYVEKAVPDAEEFYTRKVAQLEKNLKDLEGVIQGKGRNLAVVEDVLRQKVLAAQAGGEQGAAAA